MVLQSIPLVAVTALAMVGDRDKVLAAGFDCYIAKPIDPETFVQQVELFLKESRAWAGARVAYAHCGSRQRARHDTVLVVDNLPVNLDLARSILEAFGLQGAGRERNGRRDGPGGARSLATLPAMSVTPHSRRAWSAYRWCCGRY